MTQQNRLYNLPYYPLPFIGRSREIQAITQLLCEPNTRLLTIVGPGGMGKTHLSVEIAREVVDHFTDGVFFVSLLGAQTPDEMIPAIGRALKLSFELETLSAQEQLIEFLQEQQVLLILDNCEHLISGAEQIAQWLQKTSGAKILATSREPLNLQAERVWILEGMDVPQESEQAEMELYSAAQLFIERARRANSQFIFAQEAPDVIEICRLVNGAPLALELAAGWRRMLSCRQIAEKIDDNMDFLSAHARDRDERHRSMRAVFDSSWELLSKDERRAFQSIAVFRDSFDPLVAERITGVSLAALAALVDKSLIRSLPSGRYKIHEILRQFADEKLIEATRSTAMYNAHSEYYAGFLQERENELKLGNRAGALEVITTEFENIKFAWDWMVAAQKLEWIERCMETLYWYCRLRGLTEEGQSLFERVRKQFAKAQGEREQMLWIKSLIRFPQLQANLREHFTEVMAFSRYRRDQAEMAFCLYRMGETAIAAGNKEQAITHFNESLRRYEESGDHFYIQTVQQRLDDIRAIPDANMQLEEPLTERELEVMQLIVEGHDNQAIADKLVISVYTVKKHVNHIFRKLNAAHRYEAIARVRELGLY